MGTNFYMFTKKKELKPFFGTKLELIDDPDFGYQIHIAKTSCGWQPSFEAHDHIRSVADLKLLYDKGDVQILDEYGQKYTWDEFVERVVNFGSEINWRTGCHNDQSGPCDYAEFTSVDGYRFTPSQFR